MVQPLGGHGAQRFADRHGAHGTIGRDAAVELAQEGPAVLLIVFPGVLAIEDDGNQRVAAGVQDRAAVGANSSQEVFSRFRGAHARVDEADQVAEEMIAEDHANGPAIAAPSGMAGK